MKIIRLYIALITCLLFSTVEAAPTADFSYVGDCQGQDVQFTSNSTPLSGQIILHVWDFGDGHTSSAVNPSHQFEFAGFYTVTLTVFDSNGDFDISTEVIQIYSSPIASFSLSSEIRCQDEAILFTNNSTDFASSLWEFGDGNFSNSIDGSHTYAAASRYTVGLTVSNSNCTSSIEKEIDIFPLPDPVFSVSNTCENEELKIDNQTVDVDNSYEYQWFVNNELKSTESDPRIFSQAGENTIMLEAINSHGCKASLEKTLDVLAYQRADFEIENACLGEQVALQPDNSALVTSEWTLNSQNPIIGGEFSFSAASIGNNVISREVRDSNGCRDSVSKSFTVFPSPQVSFGLDDHCFETIVSPVNTSSILTGSLSYTWTVEEQNLNDAEPQIQFSRPGSFAVQLEAVSDQGCRASQTKEVIVLPQPQAGTISGSTFFCEDQGSTVVLSVGNFDGEIKRWEKKEFGSSYWQIISHTKPQLDITELKMTTDYRVVVGNTECEEVSSDAFTVNFRPAVFAGQIDGLGTVCGTEEHVKLTYQGQLSERIFWEALEGDEWITVAADVEFYELDLALPWRQLRVIISDDICQSDTSEIFTLNVVQRPGKPLITGKSRYCADQEKVLTAENIESTSYTWQISPNGVDDWMNLSTNERELELSSQPETNVYRIEVDDAICGYVYSDPFLVEVLPKSNAGRIKGPGAVCAGDSVKLDLTDYVGEVIEWLQVEDGSLIASNSKVISVIPERTSVYQAVVSNAFCEPDTTQKFTVLVNQLPQPQIEIEGFCSSDSITLSNLGQAENESHTWSLLNQSYGQEALTTSLPAGQYDILLAVENEFGCRASDRRQFTVFASPLAAFDVEAVCSNEPVRITDLSAENLQQSWKLDGVPILPDTLSFLEPGRYQVGLTVTSEDGCTDSRLDDMIIHSVPSISIQVSDVCFGDSVYASLISNQELDVISWTLDNDELTGSIDFSFLPVEDGVYSLEARALSKQGCRSDDMTEVQVNPQPVADFQVANQCAGDTLLLSNATEGANLKSVIWYESDVELSDEDKVHLIRGPGRYKISLEVIASGGCTDKQDSIIQVFERPSLSFDYEGLCEDDLFQFRVPNADSAVDYLWNINGRTIAGGPEISFYPEVAEDLLITLSGINAKGCVADLSQTIEVHPVPAFSIIGQDHCYGSESTFSILEESKVPTVYTWKFGDGRSFLGLNLTTTFLNAGPQYLRAEAITSAGCEYHVLDTVQVFDAPIANFFAEDICLGESLSTNNTTFFETETAIFQWNIDGFITSTRFNLDTLLSTAGERRIDLKVIDSNGCSDSVSRRIHVHPIPEVLVADSVLSASKGYAVQLSASGANSYLWQPPTGVDNVFAATTEARPVETTQYEVIGTNEYGCEGLASVQVNVTEDFRLLPSNVLTPDGNGQNDRWVIRNADVYENVSVRIFDRQGRLVYNNPSYRNDWDGTFGNDLLPEGTYYYEVSHPGQTQTYQGSLTILRSR